jgi:lysyl-tRNA synthetase class 2
MTAPSNQPPADTHPLEAQRRANRDAAAALGALPYGRRTDGLHTLAHAFALYNPDADAQHQAHAAALKANPATPEQPDPRPETHVAGRIVLLRDGGKLIWLTLRDHTRDLQVAVSARDVPAAHFSLAKLLDLADLVTVRGRLMKTKAGEVTVWASSIQLAAKSLAQPPEKHAGLADIELRYRQRYTDLWATPAAARVFQLRSRVVSRMRRLLDEQGYMEVETPMLQTLPGGAAARPFRTHMNALGIDLYLRIAPELYLKRLLVGGLPKVYEINRNFRNEGLDKRHNPEFTMLEAYCAYGDVHTVTALTEHLVRACAELVAIDLQDAARTGQAALPEGALPDQLKLPFGAHTIDYGAPFLHAPYPDLFERALGIKMSDADAVLRVAAERHIPTKGAALAVIVNELFERFAEPTLDPARPTFITDYPSAISPLTRPKPENPALADRADLFIAGMEVAPHYTELNDPDVQAAKFREQLNTGDADKTAEESTFRTYDADFIDALKVGMPPAGGMGLGIDRLVMLLLNQPTIRDVLLFPMMRPERAGHGE